MTHKIVIETVKRTLKDITNCSSIFGSENIILARDFRQIPPIMKYAPSNEVICASVKCSYIWNKLKKLKLILSQRNKADINFSK